MTSHSPAHNYSTGEYIDAFSFLLIQRFSAHTIRAYKNDLFGWKRNLERWGSILTASPPNRCNIICVLHQAGKKWRLTSKLAAQFLPLFNAAS